LVAVVVMVIILVVVAEQVDIVHQSLVKHQVAELLLNQF